MSEALKTGDLILNRYEVIGVLGQGGMGVVYRCLDRVSDMLVAVKGLVPELSGDAAQMEEVKKNFQLVAELRHSAIAGLRNLEQDPATGAYYLVMDYVRGYDLPKYIKENKLSLGDTFTILVNVADALDYAHQEGVLHRDVKPENVKIAEDGAIKLLDFGIAAKLRTQSSGGTPWYMAPEQWYGEKQGPETDEYALAAMAYEIVYGQVPHQQTFTTTDDYNVMAKAALKEPLTFPDKTPEKVQAVFRKALAPKLTDRYPTCRKFIRALAVAMGYVKIARPKYARLAWSIVATLGILALGIGSYWWHEHEQLVTSEIERETNHQKYLFASNALVKARANWQNAQDKSDAEKVQLKADLEKAEKAFAVEEAKRRVEAEKAEQLRLENSSWQELKDEVDAKARQIEADQTNLASNITAWVAETNRLQHAISDKNNLIGRQQGPFRPEFSPYHKELIEKQHRGFRHREVSWIKDSTNSNTMAERMLFHSAAVVWKEGRPVLNAELLCHKSDKSRTGNAPLVTYVTFMAMSAEHSYTFYADVNNRAQILIENDLVINTDGALQVDRYTYHPPSNGWYRVTLSLYNANGCPGPSIDYGIRYREDEGPWREFMGEGPDGKRFRTEVKGRDPVEEERYIDQHRKDILGRYLAEQGVRHGADLSVQGGVTHHWTRPAADRDLGAGLIPDDHGPFTVELWMTPKETDTNGLYYSMSYLDGQKTPHDWFWKRHEKGGSWVKVIDGWHACCANGWTAWGLNPLPAGQKVHLALSVGYRKDGAVDVIAWQLASDEPVESYRQYYNRNCFRRQTPFAFWNQIDHFYLGDADYDEVRIWNRAFTFEEFRLSHKAGPKADVKKLKAEMDATRAVPRPKLPTAPQVYKLPKGAEMKVVTCSAGTFDLGWPEEELMKWNGDLHGCAAHQTTLTYPYQMSVTPVTEGQWAAVMGGNGKGDKWNYENDAAQVKKFYEALNRTLKGRLPEGYVARAPTDAEFEAALKANRSDPKDAFSKYHLEGEALKRVQEKPNRLGIAGQRTPTGCYVYLQDADAHSVPLHYPRQMTDPIWSCGNTGDPKNHLSWEGGWCYKDYGKCGATWNLRLFVVIGPDPKTLNAYSAK